MTTTFVNFVDICRALHQKGPIDNGEYINHVMKFIINELETSATLCNGRLIINGKYKHEDFENVLRKYIYSYLHNGTFTPPLKIEKCI